MKFAMSNSISDGQPSDVSLHELGVMSNVFMKKANESYRVRKLEKEKVNMTHLLNLHVQSIWYIYEIT